jgi:hypothetical protein
MLRVVVGLDVARVAAITGKRPGAVRVFTHRGLRQLAERLGADFPVRGKVASARDAYPTIASKIRISSDLTVVFSWPISTIRFRQADLDRCQQNPSYAK